MAQWAKDQSTRAKEHNCALVGGEEGDEKGLLQKKIHQNCIFLEKHLEDSQECHTFALAKQKERMLVR